MEKTYTPAEAAEKLGIGRRYLYELIRRKKIGSTKLGGRKIGITETHIRKYRRSLLEDYIKEKLKILKELHMELTYEQSEHLWRCNTEFEVDAYYHSLIINYPY